MFCSRCGTPLSKAPPIRCEACGIELFRNPKPCAGALVTRAGRLLLVRRSREPWSGRWDIPGGFCEADEHPIHAAVREVAEETGLSIRLTGLLGMFMDDYGEGPYRGVHEKTLNIYFHAVAEEDDEPVPDREEIFELGWFAPSELPAEMAFPDHENAVIRIWRNAVETGNTTGFPSDWLDWLG